MLNIYLKNIDSESTAHKQEMLLRALSDFGILNAEGSMPRIEKGRYGKPFLPEHPSFFYNFSDSGNWIALAASDQDVGIDIQKVVPVKRGVDSLAERFYPEEESALILSQPDEQKKASLFFRLWTIREAYLKLSGTGLSSGMAHFPVDYTEGCLAGGCGDAVYQILPDPAPGIFLCVSQFQSSSPTVLRM